MDNRKVNNCWYLFISIFRQKSNTKMINSTGKKNSCEVTGWLVKKAEKIRAVVHSYRLKFNYLNVNIFKKSSAHLVRLVPISAIFVQ